jgi:hypothetical protein
MFPTNLKLNLSICVQKSGKKQLRLFLVPFLNQETFSFTSTYAFFAYLWTHTQFLRSSDASGIIMIFLNVAAAVTGTVSLPRQPFFKQVGSKIWGTVWITPLSLPPSPLSSNSLYPFLSFFFSSIASPPLSLSPLTSLLSHMCVSQVNGRLIIS